MVKGWWWPVLAFAAGVMCPFAVLAVGYWIWLARGRNVGWPT